MANKLVYHSWWMITVMVLLSVNLSMVLIDRWPWKKRHLPFILAHIGIFNFNIRLSFDKVFWSGWLSSFFKRGGKKHLLSVFLIWRSKFILPMMEKNFSLIYEEPVDMFFIKPNSKKPYVISTANEQFVINRYLPFSIGRAVFKPVLKNGRPAVRFHLGGSQASLVEWMYLDVGEDTVSQSFGPAVISLTKDSNYKAKTDKELVLYVEKEKLFYALSNEKKQPLKKGLVFSTGWMDFQFRLLEFFPQSQKEFVFESQDKPSDRTLKAVRVNHQGNSVWLGQNSYARFFKGDRVLCYGLLEQNL